MNFEHADAFRMPGVQRIFPIFNSDDHTRILSCISIHQTVFAHINNFPEPNCVPTRGTLRYEHTLHPWIFNPSTDQPHLC